MNRAEMEAVIDAGGSVMINLPDNQGSRTITRKEHLPTHEQLGEKDPALAAASREELEARLRAIEDQLRTLDRKADDAGEAEKPIEGFEGFPAADDTIPRGTDPEPTDGKASTPSPTADAFKAPPAAVPATAAKPADKPVEKKK